MSFGTELAPTGCNPHTESGDSAGTRMVLGAVLPSAFEIGTTGIPTANPELITQSELISTKPETIVYTLNPNAVWSDGVPITAADFVYAWQQQRAISPTDPGAVSSTEGYRDIAAVTGSNKGHTVTVTFRTPFADWKMLFANLLPAHVMEKVGWNPSCSTVSPSIDLSGGPFELSSVSSQEIVLNENPKWWGTVPNARSITVHIASGTSQLSQWIQSGFVQVALPTSLSPTFLDQVTSLPNEQSSVTPSGALLQLVFAAGPNTPLAPDVRFAIALSLNRQALVTQQVSWAVDNAQVASSHIYVQGQTGYPATPPTPSTTTTNPANAPPPGSTSSTTTTLIDQGGSVNFPTTPSLQQAADLMLASGEDRTDGSPWHADFGVAEPIHLVFDNADPWAAATAPQLVSQLQAAGFDVTSYGASSATEAGEILANGYADMALVPQQSTPFLSQVLAWYTPLLGPPGVGGSQDWSDYDDASFEQLVTTASQQLNPNTAATDYAAADTQLWTDLVAVPLFAEPSALVWSRRIGGVATVPSTDSLLWYGQYWAVRALEPTDNTTPTLPTP